MRNQTALPYMWMLCGCVAFTVMTAFAHALGTSCDWQIVALARSALAMLFAAILTLRAGARLVLWQSGTLWVRSLAGSTSLLCTFFALSRLPVADVLALTNTFPIWVAVLSWPLLGEAPPAKVWLAIAIGIVGVWLIQQPHLARGDEAILFALAASFSTAVAMLGLHRLQNIDARAIVTHFSGVASLFCIAAFFLFDHTPAQRSLSGGWALAGLLAVGVSATIGQLFLTKAFAAGPPAKVSLVALTQIAFGLLVDTTIFGHELNVVSLVGIILVVAPTAWVLGSTSTDAATSRALPLGHDFDQENSVSLDATH